MFNLIYFLGTDYYTNVRITNTLQKPVQFSWQSNNLQLPSLYANSPTNYLLQPGENKDYTLKASSLKSLSNEQLLDALNLFAYVDGNARKTLLINKQEQYKTFLSKDDRNKAIILKITEPSGKCHDRVALSTYYWIYLTFW